MSSRYKKQDHITLDTVETTHNKFLQIVSLARRAFKNNPEKLRQIDNIENEYILSVSEVLSRYYLGDEKNAPIDYYRIITHENFSAKLNAVLGTSGGSKELDQARKICPNMLLENVQFDICVCGSRMDVVPELSELKCSECGMIKYIEGVVFRDEQFYPQEGQKTKHSGYDTSRHYKFWMERLQAMENVEFDRQVLNNIEYVIRRDGYDRAALTCAQMREILKDPMVKATRLNDHIPRLVVAMGGPAPPRLDFADHKVATARFNKIMMLYERINTKGGNKPYYPYFLYKIFEEMFKDNPEKLRILDYIHLQSQETIVKNDRIYEQICKQADPGDGLVYRPTDRTKHYRL